MEELRMIQCYHCMTLGHTKDKCPQRESPQICGRCGDQGHGSFNCEAPHKCHLCGENGHPATARICQVYKQKFTETITKLLSNPPENTNLFTVSSKTVDLCNTSQGDNLLSAVNSEVLSSNTPLEFSSMLFTLLKASSSASGPPIMTYGAETDEEVSLPNISVTLPAERVGIEPTWDHKFETVEHIPPTKIQNPDQAKHAIKHNVLILVVPQETIKKDIVHCKLPTEGNNIVVSEQGIVTD